MQRMRRWAVIAGLALAASSSPAGASEITTIKYDLSQSSFLDVTPPIAQIIPVTGMVTLGFESSGGVPLVSGKVDLLTLSFIANGIDFVYFTANIGLRLTVPATGGHLKTPHLVTPGASVMGAGMAISTLHCVATVGLCGSLGLPRSVPVSYQSAVPISVGTINFLRSDLGQFSVMDPLDGYGTFHLVGDEISRTTTPEPASLPLMLVAGLALLAPLAWRARPLR